MSWSHEFVMYASVMMQLGGHLYHSCFPTCMHKQIQVVVLVELARSIQIGVTPM